MPCPADSVASTPGEQIVDLLFVHPFTAAVQYEPQDKPELVAAVANATESGRSLRALGSNWSLSAAGIADDVVDTTALRMHLSQPYPKGSAALDPARIRGEGSDFLEQACASDPRSVGHYYVHVEAGIKIKDLLADLGACGLALATMGDGAGQSLIGALSTATHGADFQVPPLVEWLRAVHLVGPAGQEWWITPETTTFGNAALLRMLPDWCPDAQIVADDDTFNAVRVGVGRMGVVYAVILEVIPGYTLLEVNLEHRWRDIRTQLAVSSVAGGTLSGIFDAPLADLESEWLRTEVLKRTFQDPAQPPGSDPQFRYIGGPGFPEVPIYSQQHPYVYQEAISYLGFDDLAAELRGGPLMPLHHMNLAISLSTPDRCWIRRRWSCQKAVRPVNLGQGPDDPVVAAIKANKANPSAIVDPLGQRIQQGIQWWQNALGWLCHDSQWERLQWYLNSEFQRVADETAAIGATSFEALVLSLYEMGTDLNLQIGNSIASAASGIIANAFADLVRAGPASGGMYANMLDNHDYELDGGEAGDSVEFSFDASANSYLDFIDAIVNLANVYFPVFGYIGVRFTPRSTALIAMQQFDLTVSVEVSTAKTRVQDLFGAFWNDVHNAATAHGGIPHWGQEFRQSAEYLDLRYGNQIAKWRAVLASLSADGPAVFSTPFSRDKGLEPDWNDDAIDMFLLALAGGDDYTILG